MSGGTVVTRLHAMSKARVMKCCMLADAIKEERMGI